MTTDEKEELLVILMEECAEVQIEASKIIRFGGNQEALENEVGDLMCMVELMYESNLIRPEEVQRYIHKKREKLKKWSNLNIQ